MFAALLFPPDTCPVNAPSYRGEMKYANLLALPLLLLPTTALARLSPPEKAMVAAADKEIDGDIALLEKPIAQNSGTRNVEGVKKVRDMVVPELAALGFTTRWVAMDAVQRAGHLIALHAGKPSTTRMLLIGHLDTVFEPSSPFQSAKREGNVLHGPGAADDKGGVVAMLAALQAMKAAGTPRNANNEVVLTGDEEAVGGITALSLGEHPAATQSPSPARPPIPVASFRTWSATARSKNWRASSTASVGSCPNRT